MRLILVLFYLWVIASVALEPTDGDDNDGPPSRPPGGSFPPHDD